MPQIKVAFLGFGNVGQALARLLLNKQDLLQEEHSLGFSASGIATNHHGMAIDAQGIDLERALQLIHSGGDLSALSRHAGSLSPIDFIQSCGADVLFESIPVNYVDGQPAVDYLRAALEAGMHVITANKGPVVYAFDELTRLALKQGRRFLFESAVMDGAPIFSLFRECLPAISLRSFTGILNSTTNLVLTRMESGESLAQAIAYAQSIGIAETDPSGDIDGWDASVKVAALVTVLMGIPLKPHQVDRAGIRHLAAGDVLEAKRLGRRWKLVCTAWRDGDRVLARVAPEMVGPDSPLYSASGTTSIVTFETDVLPSLSIVEGNPGTETTAYGMLADFIRVST